MNIYRISYHQWAGKLTASGEENRWNDTGSYVIYTASSIALSCLEKLVHMHTMDLDKSYSITFFSIPDSTKIKTISVKQLDKDWVENNNENSKSRTIGRKWYNHNESLILAVPSSIIPWEFNYLINTQHPDFKTVEVNKTESFVFDKRLLEK